MPSPTRTALQCRAAEMLDATHHAASVGRGVYTIKAREILAGWLDGKPCRISYVRKLCAYLFSIAHPYDGRSRGPSYYRNWT